MKIPRDFTTSYSFFPFFLLHTPFRSLHTLHGSFSPEVRTLSHHVAMLTTPDQSPGPTTANSSSASKSQRVLACVLCQQRKVKCDRRFPCANCTRHNVQCVPATQVRRTRRRRFPERELLDRVRRYEDLLRANKVKFEPLHGEQSGSGGAMEGGPMTGSDAEEEEEAAQPTPEQSSPAPSESVYEARYV